MSRAQVVLATLFAYIAGCFSIIPPESGAAPNQAKLAGRENVLFDCKERIWKRWSASSGIQNGIMYAESRDGKVWRQQVKPAFTANSRFDAWDAFSVDEPKVVQIPSNAKDKRFVLFYSGAAEGSAGIPAILAARGLGIAYSGDGRLFRRLKASESPYGLDGLVLCLAPVRTNQGRTRSLFSSPQLAFNNGSYEIWYSKMSVDSEGKVESASISHAISSDGISWIPDRNNPLTVHLGSQSSSKEKLSRRLNRLSVAFKEAASM